MKRKTRNNNRLPLSPLKAKVKLDGATNCSYTYSIEWDSSKSQQNLDKHGLDFACAHEIFDDFHLEREDKRNDYGEDRVIVLGIVQGREIVLVYTLRGKNYHIISLRKANAREQKIYQQERLKALGCNDRQGH